MSTAPQPRLEGRARREGVRAAVREAVLELVREAPFKDLTIERIAAAAGLTRSAFYVYFADKQELLMAMTEEVVDDLHREADRWWRGDGPPEARVRAALAGVVEVYAANARLLRVANEVSGYDDEIRDLWRRLVERFVAETVGHIRAEQAAERIPPALDAQAAAETLVWMVERCCYIYLARGERRPEALVDALAQTWVGALYPGRQVEASAR